MEFTVRQDAEGVDTIRRGQRGGCARRSDDRGNAVEQHLCVEGAATVDGELRGRWLIGSAAMHYARYERQEVFGGALLQWNILDFLR
jgi:hypothetical protein